MGIFIACVDGLKGVPEAIEAIYPSTKIHLSMTSYQLENFSEKWKDAYPMVVKSWRQNWVRVIPMFSFAPEIRKAIYTTNTIESLNMTLRMIVKNRAMFPSDEAVFRMLSPALKNVSKRWTMPI